MSSRLTHSDKRLPQILVPAHSIATDTIHWIGRWLRRNEPKRCHLDEWRSLPLSRVSRALTLNPRAWRKSRFAVAVPVVCLLTMMLGTASAHADTWLACHDHQNLRAPVYKQRPRGCVLTKGSFVAVKLHHLRWHGWGNGHAWAKGKAFHEHARALAYRKRRGPSCGPGVSRPPFYTRVRVKRGHRRETFNTTPESC